MLKLMDLISEDLLKESVFDKSILKCVFMAGGPGSGKSYVAKQLFGIPEKFNISMSGMKMINQDKEYKYLLKKHGFTLDVIDRTANWNEIQVLQENDSVALRQVLKGAFDPNIEWLLPKGDVPYTVNEAPLGTEHTLLSQEAKRLYLFTQHGDSTISQTKREMLFIQLLEGLSGEEAKFLVTVVNQKVNNEYKGFTANLVKEAFDWDDNFMKKENRPSFPV